MTLQLDHLVVACHDLDATADRLQVVLGGVPEIPHTMPEWGTSSRILLLAGTALEVIAVTDLPAAQAFPVGRVLLAALQGGDRLAQLCVRSDDLDAHAARVGIAAPEGAGTDRYAGFLDSVLAPGLPFFVERAAVATEDLPRLEWVEVGVGDPARLERFLDDGSGARPDVRVIDGAPGIHRAGVITDKGTVVLQDGAEHVLTAGVLTR